jgi:hypothetical protein
MITQYYKDQLRTLHSRDVMWGSSAGRWRGDVMEHAEQLQAKTILDYGCGKGHLKLLTEKFGFEVREYDPGIPGKDGPPAVADMVACLDVLEHIEPDQLDSALEHMKSLAFKGALFVAALYPSGTRLPDGRDSHLILESPEWWVAKVESIFGPVKWDHRARPTRNPNRVKDVVVMRAWT